MARILVLGGGFGGLEAANRLRAALPDEHEITVIDRRERFLPGLTKLWNIVGISALADNTRPLSGLEDKGIRFRRAAINRIDPRARAVDTSEGRFEADYMVIALGAAYAPAHLEMLTRRAHNLYDPVSGDEIKQSLADLERGRIAIVIMGLPYKCPPAPFEASFLIDEWLRDHNRRDDVELAVYTPQPSPLPVAGPQASARVAATLAERGIELYTEHKLTGVVATAHEATFEKKDPVGFSLLLGVPKHVVPKVLAEPPLVGDSGWIEPDPQTFITAFERVYAVGDCTAVPIASGQLPKAGVFAEAQARVAAANILADLTGSDPARFDGHGYCYLEFAGRTAASVKGNFYAQPKPDIVFSDPSEETFREKGEFVQSRLNVWL